ncbi:DNA/RNA nuclease SfsA [Amaricoccus macauensis]|uniref:DNA/RNA nuclease SfsA n=1 Tax=Amaricoccus macauensis TaxID=57001 RepID=UPI003C7BD8AF
MKFETPLIQGTLLRRYKRFLADILLEDGREVTAHCANPGAMLGLNSPGMKVWLEPSNNPKRKLPFSWRLVELEEGHLAGIDTSLPNRLVGEALAEGRIAEIAGYENYRPEVKYGTGSRVDFLATGEGQADTYIEVKNVHLRREGDWAEFPDCVTTRGAKHLRELALVAQSGRRAVMLFVVQRTDCGRFRLAEDLDPAYARAFAEARAAGVEAIAYQCAITTAEIRLAGPVPVQDPIGG